MRLIVAVTCGIALFFLPRFHRGLRFKRALPFASAALSAGFFVAANTLNLCSPGWCDRRGFPFEYKGWSDAQLIMNDVNYGVTPFNPVILGVDISVAVVVTYIIFRLSKSQANRPAV
jgi:hypothetical protein